MSVDIYFNFPVKGNRGISARVELWKYKYHMFQVVWGEKSFLVTINLMLSSQRIGTVQIWIFISQNEETISETELLFRISANRMWTHYMLVFILDFFRIDVVKLHLGYYRRFLKLRRLEVFWTVAEGVSHSSRVYISLNFRHPTKNALQKVAFQCTLSAKQEIPI